MQDNIIQSHTMGEEKGVDGNVLSNFLSSQYVGAKF